MNMIGQLQITKKQQSGVFISRFANESIQFHSFFATTLPTSSTSCIIRASRSPVYHNYGKNLVTAFLMNHLQSGYYAIQNFRRIPV